MATALNVNPAMIKWAREDAGYTLEELPGYLQDAEKWENGEETPSWSDLRNLAKKYKRPSFFYFLKEPPQAEDDFIEFRSDDKIEEFSPQLRLEIRKAKHRRNAYLRIYGEMGIQIPNFSKNVNDEKNPIKLAKHIRNYLNVDLELQKKWIFNENGNKNYTHNSFLNHWKEICFDLGILVFETGSISENEFSGCSIYYEYCPIIILNGKNYPNRRIFTLMHELAHLTQGISAICDVDKHNKREAFCNKVAAEILIPSKSLDEIDLFYKNGNLKLGELSNIYGVSKQTVVYKLNSCNKIDDNLKNELITKIEESNNIKRNKDIERKKRSEPHIKTITTKNKQEGSSFTKLIIEAYDNKIITATQAMRYLDTSLDQIKEIELALR